MRIKELTYKWMNWSVSVLQFDTDKKATCRNFRQVR